MSGLVYYNNPPIPDCQIPSCFKKEWINIYGFHGWCWKEHPCNDSDEIKKWFKILFGLYRKVSDKLIWYTEDEVDDYFDFWREIVDGRKEYNRKHRMNRYQARKHYFPRLYELKAQRGCVDKEEVKSGVDMVALYQMYFPEKQVRNGNRYRQVSCGFHGEDRMASMSLDTELKRFNCFACGIKGDCFDLIMEIEGVKFGEALKILNNL